MLHLEKRSSHLDAHCLTLIAPGHNATVVIGKHNDCTAFQLWLKDSFAGNKEIIAIDKGVHYLTFLIIYVTTPHIMNFTPSVITISG